MVKFFLSFLPNKKDFKSKKFLLSIILILLGYIMMPDGPWYRQISSALLFSYSFIIFLESQND